jgi:hypothetical protein
METICFSEISVDFYRIARSNFPEDITLYRIFYINSIFFKNTHVCIYKYILSRVPVTKDSDLDCY